MSGSSKCKHCGRPIVWGKTVRGSGMAIDPSPRADGRYVLEATGVDDGHVVFAVRRARVEDAPEQRRTCHFDTCPERRRER